MYDEVIVGLTKPEWYQLLKYVWSKKFNFLYLSKRSIFRWHVAPVSCTLRKVQVVGTAKAPDPNKEVTGLLGLGVCHVEAARFLTWSLFCPTRI